MTLNKVHREAVPEMPNRLGIAGIEFIEYATSRPQALGQVLENMGFRPVARHRSREVTLYRQGTMNLVVNASPDDARVSGTVDGQPVISAVAFRVQDAKAAYEWWSPGDGAVPARRPRHHRRRVLFFPECRPGHGGEAGRFHGCETGADHRLRGALELGLS